MKKQKLVLALALGLTLLLANRAQAYYTNFLDVASNALSATYTTLTNNPNPSPADKKTAARIKRALADLSRPSTNVVGDYTLFLAAASHLGPVAVSPDFVPIGSNVFNLFTNEAQAQIFAAADRVAALNDFVRTKRAASNQVVQAQSALLSIDSASNPPQPGS